MTGVHASGRPSAGALPREPAGRPENPSGWSEHPPGVHLRNGRAFAEPSSGGIVERRQFQQHLLQLPVIRLVGHLRLRRPQFRQLLFEPVALRP